MKKMIVMVVMAVVASATVNAQSAAELAKQQKELNSINMKMLNAKPSKDAKKRAKKLTKEGWMVVGSGKSIEKQITDDQLLAEELMADENGSPTKRFIQHSSTAVAGTQNAAFATARATCQSEIAAMIETKIAGAMQQKIDNAQSSAINATTVSKFHERVKSIIDASLTNARAGLNIYRVLQNNNYESQVTISFDKKELAARFKTDNAALFEWSVQQLEQEGDDELNDVVDVVMANWE